MLPQKLVELKLFLKSSLLKIKTMELDDFKNEWSRFDDKLTQNLKVNEDVLRTINLNKTKREMFMPLITELVSALTNIMVIVVVAFFVINNISLYKYVIAGMLVVFLCVSALSASVIKIKMFFNIDYINSSVVKLQRDLAYLNVFILKCRRYELLGVPFLTAGLLPIAFKMQMGIDIFERPLFFIAEFIFVSFVSYRLARFLNRKIFDKKFANVANLLKDIKEFENEE